MFSIENDKFGNTGTIHRSEALTALLARGRASLPVSMQEYLSPRVPTSRKYEPLESIVQDYSGSADQVSESYVFIPAQAFQELAQEHSAYARYAANGLFVGIRKATLDFEVRKAASKINHERVNAKLLKKEGLIDLTNYNKGDELKLSSHDANEIAQSMSKFIYSPAVMLAVKKYARENRFKDPRLNALYKDMLKDGEVLDGVVEKDKETNEFHLKIHAHVNGSYAGGDTFKVQPFSPGFYNPDQSTGLAKVDNGFFGILTRFFTQSKYKPMFYGIKTRTEEIVSLYVKPLKELFDGSKRITNTCSLLSENPYQKNDIGFRLCYQVAQHQ